MRLTGRKYLRHRGFEFGLTWKLIAVTMATIYARAFPNDRYVAAPLDHSRHAIIVTRNDNGLLGLLKKKKKKNAPRCLLRAGNITSIKHICILVVTAPRFSLKGKQISRSCRVYSHAQQLRSAWQFSACQENFLLLLLYLFLRMYSYMEPILCKNAVIEMLIFFWIDEIISNLMR